MLVDIEPERSSERAYRLAASDSAAREDHLDPAVAELVRECLGTSYARWVQSAFEVVFHAEFAAGSR